MPKASTTVEKKRVRAASQGDILRNLDTGEIALFMGTTKYITLVPAVRDNYQLIGCYTDDWHNMDRQRWTKHDAPVVLQNCTHAEYTEINDEVDRKREQLNATKEPYAVSKHDFGDEAAPSED